MINNNTMGIKTILISYKVFSIVLKLCIYVIINKSFIMLIIKKNQNYSVFTDRGKMAQYFVTATGFQFFCRKVARDFI